MDIVHVLTNNVLTSTVLVYIILTYNVLTNNVLTNDVLSNVIMTKNILTNTVLSNGVLTNNVPYLVIGPVHRERKLGKNCWHQFIYVYFNCIKKPCAHTKETRKMKTLKRSMVDECWVEVNDW